MYSIIKITQLEQNLYKPGSYSNVNTAFLHTVVLTILIVANDLYLVIW